MKKIFTLIAPISLLGACVTDGKQAYDPTQEITAEDSSVVRLARSTAQAGDTESAITILRQGINTTPDRPGLYIELADILSKSNRFQEAANVLEQGAKVIPNHPVIMRKLGNSYLSQGQSEKVIVIYDRALASNTNDIRLLNSKATALDILGKKSEAQQVYSEVLKLDDDNVTALNNVAMSHILAGDYVKAKGYLERAAMSSGSNSQVRQNLAMVYALTGEKDKAQRMGLQDLSEDEVKQNLQLFATVPNAAIINAPTAEVAKVQSVQPAMPATLGAPNNLEVKKAEPVKLVKPENKRVNVASKAPVKPLPTVAPAPTPVAPIQATKPLTGAPEVKVSTVTPTNIPDKVEGTEDGAPLADKSVKIGSQTKNPRNFWDWLAGKPKATEANKAEVAAKPVEPVAKEAAAVVKPVVETPTPKPQLQQPAQLAAKPVDNANKGDVKVLWEKPLSTAYKPDSTENSKVIPTTPTQKPAEKLASTPPAVAKTQEPIYLKLGSFDSKKAAEDEFSKMSKSINFLTSYKPIVTPEDGQNLLLVGPFMYHEQYAKLCQQLLQNGSSCTPHKFTESNN